jgi:hypothetical protein
MSIISDALKKAQEENKNLKEVDEAVKTVSVEKAEPKKKNKSLILAVLLMILSSVITFVLMQSREDIDIVSSGDNIVLTKEIERASPPGPVSSQAPLPKKQSTTRRRELSSLAFELSGIVYGSGRPYAIINDTVFEKGDSIGGGKITGIEKNKVTILVSGEEVTLSLK